MLKPIESQKEALSVGRNGLENAAARGPWMAMVWSLEEGEVQCRRVSWEFPHEKLPEVMETMKKSFDELQEKVVKEAPLPVAETPSLPFRMPQLTEAVEAAEEKTPCPVELPETPDDLGGVVEVVEEPLGD